MQLRTQGGQRRRTAAVAAWIGLGAMALGACAGGTTGTDDDTAPASGSDGTCTNTVVNPDAEQVTVWA